jgi:hypothetical protein
VKTGVQGIDKFLKILGSGACPGPDPGFAGMTEREIFGLFTEPSKIVHCHLKAESGRVSSLAA